MKKFTQMLLGLCLAGTTMVNAQQSKTVTVDALSQPSHLKRCATMELLAAARQRNPQGYQNEMAARRAASMSQLSTARTSALTQPVTIPVVVHIVLSNPTIIGEEQIDAMIDRLNLDYSGNNPDSTNGANWYSRRGRSMIRFARARRTPGGQLTNGIERRASPEQIAGDTYQPIKHFSDGGLDPWDIEKYYNIWVGNSGASGILGIAPAIGKGNATEDETSAVGIDGICVDYRVFTNSCIGNATTGLDAFNMGRTITHEVGHNFGLYHTFHYDPSIGVAACSAGADFIDADSPLPATLIGTANDDTPSQSQETSGCPSGNPASDCTGAGAKMYQNYMDYTDDACYSMFTKKQVGRMEYVLEFYRSGYLTSLGATPPAGSVSLDVAPASLVSPGSIEFSNTACTLTSYPIPLCAGNITPRILVQNRGTTNITSFTVSVSNNNGTPVSTNVTGINIGTGRSTYVSLPSIALVAGANVLKFTTSAPNGSTDGNAANDILTTTVTVGSPVSAPISEGFEGATFPPANFVLYNPNGDSTWVRRPNGRNSATSIYINNYDNPTTGTIDDLRAFPMNLTPGADSLVISFDLAHKAYGVRPADTLQILATTNCGTSYFELYKKWGYASLATTTDSLKTSYLVPAAGDWRRERIAFLASNFSPAQVQVIFRNKNRWGNNIFLDNINISSTCRSTSIATQPAAVTVCSGQAASFTVGATGSSITYQWKKDGVAISGANSATYSIASTAAANAGSYTVDVTNACGTVTTSNGAALVVNTGGACGGTAVANINPDVAGVVLMPNAVHNSAVLRVNAVRAMKLDWTMIDASGRIVKRFSQAVSAGQNDVKVNVTGLAAGTYQIVGNSTKGKTNTIKFVVY